MNAPGKLFQVGDDEVKLDGEAEIGWAKGKAAGTADLSIKVRTPIEVINRAEELEAVLPGSTCIFAEGFRDAEHRPKDEDGEAVDDGPIAAHVQRTSWPGDFAWVLVGLGDTGPLDGPNLSRIEGEAPIRSLTLTASKGTVVLTIGVKLASIPVKLLPSVVALDGQRVRLLGRNNQTGLFDKPQGEPEAGPAETAEELPPEAGADEGGGEVAELAKASRRKRGGEVAELAKASRRKRGGGKSEPIGEG